jgi:hypothetical protein
MSRNSYTEINSTFEGLKNKFKLLVEKELEWYESEAQKVFKLKHLCSFSEDNLIEHIIPKSVNDLDRKCQIRSYYVANTVAFLKVIRGILTEEFIHKFASQGEDKIINHNYHRVFRNLLFDSLVLLDDYSDFVRNKDRQYGIQKSSYQHTTMLYLSLSQSIFGQVSFHSCIDVEPDLSISIIRQLIELRIRMAFGIMGWYNETNDSVEPLAMSVIFDALKAHENDIDLSIPLHLVNRIYGWSNIFLHSGLKDYSWKHILVKDYLKEFLIGKNGATIANGGFNMYSGISVSKHTLIKIKTKLEAAHPKGAKVIECEPQSIIKDC